MKKVTYGVLGIVLAVILCILLLNGIPNLISPDINKNIKYLDELEIDSYVDLSDVVTMIGYQVYPKDLQDRLANNEFAYGRSNPMYFVRINLEKPEDDSDKGDTGSGKDNSSRRSGYYVYPYAGGEVFYSKESGPTKLGIHIEEFNDGYRDIDKGVIKGYNKATSEMEFVTAGNIRDRILREAYLPVGEEYMSISSKFGVRVDPFDYSKGSGEDTRVLPFHTGLDISHPGINGTDVYNMMSGKIKSISRSNTGYGNLVIVDNGDFETYYAHLKSIDDKLVEGDVIKAGEVLGKVGSTGRSTGPHLHLEINFDGIAVNPELFIPEALINNSTFEKVTIDDIKKEEPKVQKRDKNSNGIMEFKFDEFKESSFNGGKASKYHALAQFEMDWRS